MKKGYDIKKVREILRYSHKLGIKNNVAIIAGLPYEREEDIIDSLNFLNENKKYISSVGLNKFYLEYNTPIFNSPEKYGLENIRPLINVGHRTCYAYDETNGLKWDKIVKQQAEAFKRISEYTRK